MGIIESQRKIKSQEEARKKRKKEEYQQRFRDERAKKDAEIVLQGENLADSGVLQRLSNQRKQLEEAGYEIETSADGTSVSIAQKRVGVEKISATTDEGQYFKAREVPFTESHGVTVTGDESGVRVTPFQEWKGEYKVSVSDSDVINPNSEPSELDDSIARNLNIAVNEGNSRAKNLVERWKSPGHPEVEEKFEWKRR